MVTNQLLHPPVRADRLSDQVAVQLEQFVIAQGLQPGEKIPSERELCEIMGVSRTVVREAVRSLMVKGLLDVRQGGGMVVRRPDTTMITAMLTSMLRQDGSAATFGQIQEVRRLLEVEIAGLAAERRNDDDLARLTTQMQLMTTFEHDAERWAVADVAFHEAIAAATRNPLYSVLLGSISELLTEVRRQAIRLAETPRVALYHHQQIFDAIKHADAARARAAMEAHLRESEQTFQKARLASEQNSTP